MQLKIGEELTESKQRVGFFHQNLLFTWNIFALDSCLADVCGACDKYQVYRWTQENMQQNENLALEYWNGCGTKSDSLEIFVHWTKVPYSGTIRNRNQDLSQVSFFWNLEDKRGEFSKWFSEEVLDLATVWPTVCCGPIYTGISDMIIFQCWNCFIGFNGLSYDTWAKRPHFLAAGTTFGSLGGPLGAQGGPSDA